MDTLESLAKEWAIKSSDGTPLLPEFEEQIVWLTEWIYCRYENPYEEIMNQPENPTLKQRTADFINKEKDRIKPILRTLRILRNTNKGNQFTGE